MQHVGILTWFLKLQLRRQRAFWGYFSQACFSIISTRLKVQCTLMAAVMYRVIALIRHRTWWLPTRQVKTGVMWRLWKESLIYLQSTQHHDYVILMTVKISYSPHHKTHLFPPWKGSSKITPNLNTTKVLPNYRVNPIACEDLLGAKYSAYLSVQFTCTDTRRLTIGLRSEKCIVRRFRRCAIDIGCTYTNQDNIAYYTPRLYGTVNCS